LYFEQPTHVVITVVFVLQLSFVCYWNYLVQKCAVCFVTVSMEIINATSDVDYFKLYACQSAAEGHR